MDTKTCKSLILSILLILIADIYTGFSQQHKVSIRINSTDKQLSFAGDEIKKAADDKGYEVNLSKSLSTKSKDELIIKIIPDSVSSVKIAVTLS
jgi:hypothetical protein